MSNAKGEKGESSRKGFFLTVIAMVLLSYLLISVSMWAQVMAVREARVPQKYKAEALALAISDISDQKASDFAMKAGRYALYNVDAYSYKTKQGLDYDRIGAHTDEPYFAKSLNTSMHELFMNGETDGAGAWATEPLVYSEDEKRAYTLNGWRDSVNDTCNSLGLVFELGPVKDFDFRQTDAWNMAISYNTSVRVYDREGMMSFEKDIHVYAVIPLEGYVDPMIARESQDDHVNGTPAERQIRKHPEFETPADLRPELIVEDGKYGWGWFYGNLTTSLPSDSNAEYNALLNRTILVSSWFENEAWGGTEINLYDVAGYYGAVIVTSLPETHNETRYAGSCAYTYYWQTACLNCLEWNNDPNNCGVSTTPQIWANEYDKPYIAVKGKDEWYDPILDAPAGSGIKHALLDNEYDVGDDNDRGDHGIWDIENIRDATVCGFYVLSPDAPSFTQRLMKSPWDLQGGDYGIETFVVGKWAGGSDTKSWESVDDYSRVDHMFYSNRLGNRAKGMPGCKNEEMCEDDYDPMPDGGHVGHFRIDDKHGEDYGLCDLGYDAIHCIG